MMCNIAFTFFFIVIDWVMKRSTADLQWSHGFGNLKDEDFADDIALLSHSNQVMQEKTIRIESYAGRVGIKNCTSKTKVERMNTRIIKEIKVNGNPVEHLQEFEYFGSKFSKDCNTEKEVSTRIAMASAAFSKMSPILKSQIQCVHKAQII